MTDATGDTGYGHLQLALFVDGSLLSGLVLAQIVQLKRELGIRDDQIRTFNIAQDVDKAIEHNIIACPALLRLDAKPPRLLIGELKNRQLVMAFFNSGRRTRTFFDPSAAH